MNIYDVTIRDLYSSDKRVIQVEGADPMTVHKEAYMRSTTSYEEIAAITDSSNRTVFDIKKGFLR